MPGGGNEQRGRGQRIYQERYLQLLVAGGAIDRVGSVALNNLNWRVTKTMGISIVDVLFLIVTYFVFGFIGFRLSRRFRGPINIVTWILLIVSTIFCGFFAPNARLIGVGNHGIYMNMTLQAIGIGIIIGLATRELRIRLSSKG